MVKTRQMDSILEALECADTLDGLQSATEALRDLMGIDHVIYHWVDSTGEQYACGTYSRAWQERYLEQNYLRIDPVVIGCYNRFHPVDWKRLDWSSKASRAFMAEAIEYGIGNQGLSIPLRGPNGQFALFTVNHTSPDKEWAAFIDDHRRALILMAYFLNDKAIELQPTRLSETIQPLSPRELDAMTLLAAGHSRARVAAQLQISEHTLRVYIESARFKLGALNTTHAVARALSRGLIVV
ncbi:LuxR family transcriptional regulator [Sulfitobacter alexandrii]|uniref:LuxR family transcriptional regulator n=1 Tax=Sulfitobacter alexandrii TaxID=1917485 RepID=A0A1J0WJ21_9RHOB|nr:autoinducer binding domain-containing protein [Sulfitobacter alexandrii]APE44314.1 LuxR family transcriptional regulator [Sulfitobacter alexandrii]